MLRGEKRSIQMKILLSTMEGFPKDNSPSSKRFKERHKMNMNFNGNDAPLKAVRAIMEKYGITKEEL